MWLVFTTKYFFIKEMLCVHKARLHPDHYFLPSTLVRSGQVRSVQEVGPDKLKDLFISPNSRAFFSVDQNVFKCYSFTHRVQKFNDLGDIKPPADRSQL